MSHRGRKRKQNVVRDASGKSRGEPEGIHPETIAVRLRELRREGVPVQDRQGALDALAGFALGRLLLRNRADRGDPGSINEEQYSAGQAWANLVRRHATIMGYSLGTPKSPSFMLAGSGHLCVEEPDEATIITVRRQWSDCYRALMDVCRTHGLAVRDILYAVCIDNRNINSLSATDFGNLRIGLNALVKVLRTEAPKSQGRIGAWSI